MEEEESPKPRRRTVQRCERCGCQYEGRLVEEPVCGGCKRWADLETDCWLDPEGE